MNKNILAIGITILFILSAVTPIVFGNNVITTDNKILANNYDRYFLPEFYDCYNINEIPDFVDIQIYDESTNHGSSESQGVTNSDKTTQPLYSPMDSAWPMYCHDTRHTGRSPYSTADNLGTEKWHYRTHSWVGGSPVIDDNGIIYVGAETLYAFYPNGTLKWKYDGWIRITSAPAIDENGIIYVGSIWADTNYFYAINTSDGSLNWKYSTGECVWSSPAIGNDGTIYFGDENNFINALWPNGTLRWRYKTGLVVYSSPTIGDDGTVYCGSHDENLYALYPNNGTLKWKYKTGHWIRTAPCIADDGTIYVVSLDNYIYAVNPNGTLKWKKDYGAGTSPTIGQDGTIYCGYTKLLAINPINGSLKWTFPVDGTIRGGTPCNSIDGTIFLGTSDGEDIIAINPDGTLRWKKYIGTCECAPAIGEDGTIYIGTAGVNYGRLYAFGQLDPDAPDAPRITGQISGTVGTEYEYTFKSTSPLGRDVYYYVTWGDGGVKDWFGPFGSDEEVKASHTWKTKGAYNVKVRAKDTDNLWGPWGELQVTITRNKAINRPFLNFLQSHPNLFPILQQLLLRFGLR